MLRVLFIAGQLSGGGSEKQFALFLEHAMGIEPHCFLLNAEFRIARSGSPVLRAWQLLGLIRELRPDLIHCWNTYPFVYPLASRWLHRLPVVVNVRGELTVDSDSGGPRPLGIYRWLRKADALVANSAHVMRDLESRLGIERGYVVPNGVELAAPRQATRDDGRVRVVGVGSLKPLKN
jgi:glycosyltransferase involved in cell wall biosynthesis